MSNRFYVNGVQIFGNNEMFKRTYEELEKQGARWTEDGTFDFIEIKDPDALINAVEIDSLEYLKNAICEEHWDFKKCKMVEKKFGRMTDKDLLGSCYSTHSFRDVIYTSKGEPRNKAYRYIEYWIDEQRAFTSYNLYIAIKKDVDIVGGKLVLKKGHIITSCMY